MVFIVDSDFIHIKNEKVEQFEAIANYLHNNAGQFIQSVITEDLHCAMLPEELV